MSSGRFTRVDAGSESDLDVVIVRSGRVNADDAAWQSAVESWRVGVRRLTGNRVEMVEVGEFEARRLLRSQKPFWFDVQRDGIVVYGSTLAELKVRRSV